MFVSALYTWHCAFLGDDIDSHWTAWFRLLFTAIEECIAERQLKTRKHAPWVTHDLPKSCKKIGNSKGKQKDRACRKINNSIKKACNSAWREHISKISKDLKMVKKNSKNFPLAGRKYPLFESTQHKDDGAEVFTSFFRQQL